MIALALLALALPFQEQPQMYTIAGTIVDATTHAPLARARVSVLPVELQAPKPGVSRQRPASRFAITGAEGTFGFLNIGPGKYQLSAELPGRQAQLYLSDGQYSTAIVTGQGHDTEHLMFPYHPGGTITGTVTDENGEPVRPQVHLFRKSVLDGRERVVQASAWEAASDGNFRFGHLQPGDYYIAVVARPWYAANPFVGARPGGMSAPKPSSELDLAYSLTYYPGTTEFSSATPITVVDGSTANVQVPLRAVPSVHINLPQIPQTGNNERVPRQVNGMSVMAVGPDGFLLPFAGIYGPGMFSGLAPGNYSVSVGGPESRNGGPGARQILHLTADTTIEPNAAAASPSVGGKVTVDGATQPGNRIVVFLNDNGMHNASATANEDGTFDFKRSNLSPGRYRLTFPSNPLFFVKNVTATGAALTDGELELKENSNVQLNIMLAEASEATLDGVVLQNGKPLAGAIVLLLPAKSSGADLVRRDQSNLDGSFNLKGVPRGEYQLLAIDHGHDLAYRDKSVMRPYLLKASKIEVSGSKDDLKVEAQARLTK